MAIYRKAAKRDANEPDIITALTACGATVEQLSGKDMPDLLVGWHGLTLLAEVKVPKTGKLTEGQASWHRNWAGAPVVVLTSAKEAVAWLAELAARER